MRTGPIGMGRSLTAAGFAVEGHGQDLCACGLPRTARPCKKIGMTYSILPYGIDQRAGNMVLAHHVLKTGGPVFAVERRGHRAAPIFLTPDPPTDALVDL